MKGCFLRVANIFSTSFLLVYHRYNSENYNNDISVLILEKPFTLGSNIQPAKLPKQRQPLPKIAIITGWGFSHPNSHALVLKLKASVVNIYDQITCKNMLQEYLKWYTSNIICAGNKQTDADACQVSMHGEKVV